MSAILVSGSSLWRGRLKHREVDRPPFIHYEFLHGLGKQSARETYATFQNVLHRFAKPSSPCSASLLLDIRDDRDPVLDEAYKEFRRRFGWFPRTSKGIGADSVYRAHYWTIPARRIPEAIELVESTHARNALLAERAAVQVFWAFSWKDPKTGRVLANQESWPEIDIRLPAGSSINLTLRGKPAAYLWFCLPFESPDARFLEYKAELEEALPLRVSDTHWRVRKRASTGTWRARKFNPAARNT